MPKGVFDRTKSKKRPPTSIETRIKISNSTKGIKKSEQMKQRLSATNKGRKLTWVTEEHRKKAIQKMIGRKQSPETIEKRVQKLRGQKRTEEQRKRMSESVKKNPPKYWLGKKRPPMSEEQKRKISLANKGKKLNLTQEQIINRSEKHKGEKSHLWRGGITAINAKIRNSLQYKQWRESVYKRDNYTCVWCLQVGGKLNADHLKPFSEYPELRFEVSNGRTLCRNCHKKTDTYGWKMYHKK